MIRKIKINHKEQRENVIVAFADAGYKIQIEEEKNGFGGVINSYVCYEDGEAQVEIGTPHDKLMEKEKIRNEMFNRMSINCSSIFDKKCGNVCDMSICPALKGMI